MPKLTEHDEKNLDKLSNRIFDTLFSELNLSEKRADEIAEHAMTLIRKEIIKGK